MGDCRIARDVRYRRFGVVRVPPRVEEIMRGTANKPAAPNVGIASRLTIGHPWPGVGEPER